MTNLSNVFSLKGTAFNQGPEGEYNTLTLGAGQGKSRKGFAWGIEKVFKNNLKGLVYVSREFSEETINRFCNGYSQRGEYEVDTENVEVIFIDTTLGDESLEWLVDRLNYIKGQKDYALVLDDVRLVDTTSADYIVNSLEESGSKFEHILVTQQANRNSQ